MTPPTPSPTGRALAVEEMRSLASSSKTNAAGSMTSPTRSGRRAVVS